LRPRSMPNVVAGLRSRSGPIHLADALPYSDRRTRTLRYPASPKLVCEREFDLRVGSVGAVGPQCPFTSRLLPRMRRSAWYDLRSLGSGSLQWAITNSRRDIGSAISRRPSFSKHCRPRRGSQRPRRARMLRRANAHQSSQCRTAARARSGSSLIREARRPRAFAHQAPGPVWLRPRRRRAAQWQS
jgi:hypothetical protein